MLRHAAKSFSTPGWPPAPFYCSLLLALLWVAGSLAANLDTTSHHQGRVPAAAATAADWKAEELVVHVVAHTHDDVGWLKTVDQYYYGANNTIQEAGVQYILDSVIRELRLDPTKRFIYVEIAFFERWWAEQTEDMKEVVRELVSSGRLEFINGGWCMNDEATTHYEAIVDQMTSGHRFLLREFGVQPTIGWHIDPFGHASTQASLFALMGFNAFFFARIDYQDHAQRAKTQEMEFIWRGSQSLGHETEMFTHVLYDHYGPPSGFCFECDNVDPIKDDPRLEGYNLHTRALQLVNNAKERRKVYRTNQIMMTFGDDFQFMNANINFKNMDKLIKYINANPQFGVKIMYSTPSLYIKAVHEVAESRNITWSVKTDDFFPYADYAHAYWTGYFTSRPALKGYVRSRANLLRGAERFYSVSQGILPSTDEDWALEHIQTLEYALAVAQHHDAVSGTEKQHVADDYAKQLSIGTEACEELMEQTLGQLLTKRGSLLMQEPLLSSNSRHVHSQPADPHPPLLTSCQYLNVSLCDPLTQALSQDRIVPLVITNPLAWNRSEYFAVPVPVGDFEVVDQYGQTIPSQLQKNVDRPGYLTLVFAVDVPALGYRSVVIQPSHSRLHATPVKTVVMSDTVEQANVEISNDYFSVLVNQTTKRLSFIINKQTSQSLAMQQNLLWYNASIGNPESSQASGAYIFRPNSTNPLPLTGDDNTPDLLLLTSGPIFKEFQIKWNSWASQKIRLYERSPFVEFEYNIGPINITDQWGKEVCSGTVYSYTPFLMS
ncbi:carbohydrate binding [Balamuthia mandrillaris]